LKVVNGELNDYNVDNNLTGPQQAGVVTNALSEGRKMKFTQEHLVDLDTSIEMEIFGDSFTISDQDMHADRTSFWHSVSNLGETGFKSDQIHLFCAAGFGQSVPIPKQNNPLG
jgi:hypothetical protein